MFDVWYGDVEITTLVLVLSVFMLLICGIGWAIWAIIKRVRQNQRI